MKNINEKDKKGEIIDKIEKNEFIRFFKIQNKEDGKFYYLKQIELKEESKFEIEKIINEIKVLSTINSENVFKYIKSFIKNNCFNIVMEYYEELNLRKLINKYKNEKGLIKQKNIFNLIKYICLGIKAIHDKRIIHGNLNPDNIYITKDKKIKIGNFALFKQLYNYNDYIQLNTNIYNYFAPEIIKGENITNKVDIWSLGCILYELCSLDFCFKSDNIICLNNKIINEKNSKINLNIYEHEIQNLIDSMLKKDPKERPNINEVYDIIIKYCENKRNKGYIENEINLVLKITDKDLNNDIYFLDNTNYEDEYGVNHYHDSLKELDEIKVDLFIDNKKYKFQKYYSFNEQKDYNITLKLYDNLKDCSNMFYNCENIKSIDLSKFNTSKTVNMENMFYNCQNLKEINISNLNTKNVINTSNMFFNCINLIELDLNSFDTKNIINISGMFFGCEQLNKLNISNFPTDNVTDMSNLFKNCNKLSNIDLSSFNTNKVKNMSGMFSMCENLELLDLSIFSTENVERMDEMFNFCRKLKKVILNSFNTIKVKSFEKMFYNCTSLINLDLSSFITEKIEKIDKMFHGCENLEILNIINFDMNIIKNFHQVFSGCNNLKVLFINKNSGNLKKEFEKENIKIEIKEIDNYNYKFNSK